jgi:ATP-dependent helicase/nuclease subunit B
MASRPNVFTIPPGVPFLDTLVAALLDGRLIEGFVPRDPFELADVTLYLPTRRAARAIRDSFLSAVGRPVLLPRIRALGDLDEDDLALDGLELAELPPAISVTERQLVLTKLVLGWSGALVRAAAGLPGEELVVPSSPADAARLAAALGSLIDQVGTEPDAWAGLFSGLPADLARYWEITLEFLKIATQAWPQHLAERGLIDPGVRRDRLIRMEAVRLASFGSHAPTVAAGSTGSVPATADLLAAIARLPNGAVVLPGLDQTLDIASFAEIGPSEREPAGAGHPQYGLKKLLDTLGLRREAAQPFDLTDKTAISRNRFVSEAMRPAATTERWSETPTLAESEKAEAVAEIAIVEAANEREEALAVAVILRQAIEKPGQVAALVTPDRGLALRVAVELKRWGTEVDDSAGTPLVKTPPGVLAWLVAEVALGGAEVNALLALLKHPLAAFSLPGHETRRAARALERAVLRGPRLRPGLAALRHAVATAAEVREGGAAAERRSTQAARWLSRADWARATDLAARAEAALQPLERLAGGRSVGLPELVAAHEAALRAVARDQHGRSELPAEAGEALTRAFEDLRASADAGPDIAPRGYPGLFAALVERAIVRNRGGLDPRIHILGALEARLQAFDMVVLGGLNEGTWPGQTRLDPLLSRPMRAALALEPQERRIGLAAHDFAQALGHPVVWLTRADRENGEPRVASRWLQRLTAYAGTDLAAAMRARGDIILDLARRLDRPARLDPPRRPRPSPRPELRPRRLSVTEIETLIRDPYAVYARHVLKLRPFEPLAKPPDAAERGTLIHDVLEQFVRERPRGPFDAEARTRLLVIGSEAFAAFEEFPEIATLWWPRFERIARWFVGVEAGREDVVERLVEGKGSLALTEDLELSTRADRLDRLADGRLSIVDYKTGTPPSADEVLSLSPQLPLEALIARAGGFENVAAAEIAGLQYYRLSGRGEGGEVASRGERPASGRKPAVTLPEALAATERRLAELVAYFARREAEYLSRKIPRAGRVFAGDYDHLARIAEWSVAEGTADDPVEVT